MKRIVALLLTLGIFALGCVTAWAAPQEILTITPLKENTCAPGSTITLGFGLAAGSNAGAVNVEVTYDTNAFEYVSYETGKLISDFGAIAAGNGVEGKVLFTLATLTPITEAGTLFTVTFKVDSKATGDHDFYFYSTAFSDAEGVDILTNTAQYTLSVAGESVSNVSVTPQYNLETGSMILADDGSSATGVVVSNGNNNANSGSTSSSGEASVSSVWLVVGVIILAVGGAAVLVFALVNKAKKGDNDQDAKEKKEKEYVPILNEDSNSLTLTDGDALAQQEEDQ